MSTSEHSQHRHHAQSRTSHHHDPSASQHPPKAISAPRPLDEAWRSRTLERSVKIVLIDDDQGLSTMIMDFLSDYDCSVLICHSAGVGLATAKAQKPDLIVTDFNLPDRNGFETVLQIRQCDTLRVTPVVMISGSPRAEALSENLAHEGVTLIKKPTTCAKMLEAFERALGGQLGPKTKPAAVPEEPISAGLQPPPIGQIVLNASLSPAPESARPPEPPPHTPEPAQNLQNLMDQTTELIRMGSRDVKVMPAHDHAGSAASPDDPPIIRFVNAVVTMAVEKKASDIHIEPQQTDIKVRFRLDGTLVPQMEIPSHMGSAIAARIKIMSQLNITEKRVPQDGRIRLALENGRKVEFRVSTVPSKYGEKIVMRVLGQANVKADLTSLRLPERDKHAIDGALSGANGLILVTGPTGSGKTTTLYTMIGMLNTPGRNIMTIEDPIEYELPGITQVAVNPVVGLTFEKALRAFLRQDPDIMLVGEIRDGETAEIAVKAAVTGHLVLSTLHTNDAATSVSRLGNMGVPGYMLAAALRLVVAQRLVRGLCPRCKIPSEPTADERSFLTEAENAVLHNIYRPVGCGECNSTGFKGRQPVLEVLPVRCAAMRELIDKGAAPDAIQGLGEQQGMKTLRAGSLRLVQNGDISLCEAMKLFASA
jgi:type II secretory ATPase GspE/PulE/Tfp pilus assembly ATPase PilB-like protein